MEVSNIIGTYNDRKEGWKTINKLHGVNNSDDTLMLNKLLYWRYGPNQTRFRADRKKTNRFSYVIGHWIGDKRRLN